MFEVQEGGGVVNLSDHYYEDGSPKKCWKCGCEEIKSIDRDWIAVLDNGTGPITEYESRCAACNELLGYWAYGYFDPAFMQNPAFNDHL